ncbi:unnamed protein product [Pleuronectes platessa]|uniref:Uncharacterized protein n=1 Tax=Pleuronectes platessa TaxID=8262 RepID=A0A9N7Z614_PLEPL|nr:unnamed protein product [Pleuronectes platessa]
MGTVTDGANDVCLSRGSALVRARLVTYAQSQGHQWSTAAPSVQETPLAPPLLSVFPGYFSPPESGYSGVTEQVQATVWPPECEHVRGGYQGDLYRRSPRGRDGSVSGAGEVTLGNPRCQSLDE